MSDEVGKETRATTGTRKIKTVWKSKLFNRASSPEDISVTNVTVLRDLIMRESFS